jgi:uncharacterized protein YgbK (DUF1537 family)
VPSILIVADDLTGANATAALFARRGLRTVSLLSPPFDRPAAEFDAVAWCTSSRHLSPEDAHERVAAAVAAFDPVPLVIKRIDTTLRGNVGAELDAATHALRARTAGTVRALVVAAWPRAGRVTRAGVQLVGGVPLDQVPAGRGTGSASSSARIADIIAGQSEMSVAEVGLDEVAGGGDNLREALGRDVDVLVCDALTHEHLREIADAARDLAYEADITWLPVDPGPFGVEFASSLGLLGSRPLAAVLIVAGSLTETTRGQLEEVERTMGAQFIDCDVTLLDAAALGNRIRQLLDDASPEAVVGVRTAASAGDIVRAPDLVDPDELLGSLAQGVRLALDSAEVCGIYATGGDVVAALVGALDADGIEVRTEAIPLAAAGVLRGGPYEGLPILTKGGLVGGRGDAVTCIDHLLTFARSGTQSTDSP